MCRERDLPGRAQANSTVALTGRGGEQAKDGLAGPTVVAAYEQRLRRAMIGEPPALQAPIELRDAYLPDTEAGGYVLRIREPQWFQHRRSW